ncbi:MAG: bifunctional glycosyltransferase family 2/GtrA family protein [Coriobacteriales bacterium]|nr:bifunctional glycosyltransferase family 2/GtrA family protein [Coriobacteriales bacterium]
MLSDVPIVIPAFEPDERLLDLLRDLNALRMGPVILVDDGSGDQYAPLFDQAADLIDKSGQCAATVLHHSVNRGKGAALKTAFEHVLSHKLSTLGVVTADSDGQHTPSCIARVVQALRNNQQALVLGSRNFDGDDVPWKSRMGNKITSHVFALVSGVKVSDTQTGLRAVPLPLMEACLDLPGDRFEFEIQMLSLACSKGPIVEIPIETVYDSKDNHQTHFDPFADSVRIYKALLRQPLTFVFSSLASSLIDLGLFWLFCRAFVRIPMYVAISTVAARVLSATFNFFMNSRVVFRGDRAESQSAVRYVVLAGIIMLLSAALTTMGTTVLYMVPEVVVKVVVDGLLFVLSYLIQKRFVF